MKTGRKFQPDLIVEVTAVCDRHCPGCYAPNLVSRASPISLIEAKPELFLSSVKFQQAMKKFIETSPLTHPVVGIRGGEPTRHPLLPEFLTWLTNKTCASVYLETHGRWLLNNEHESTLLSAIVETKTIVKLSFDRMHGLSNTELQESTKKLDQYGAKWCVAITEASEADFTITRDNCSWVADHAVFFQPKQVSSDGLLRSGCVVINVNGDLIGELSVRPEFKRVSALC